MRRFKVSPLPLVAFTISLALAGCGGIASNTGNTTSTTSSGSGTSSTGSGTTTSGSGGSTGSGGSGTPAPAPAPNVAYVYVSNTVGGTNEITGYLAANDGTLTALPGSPYGTNADWLAVNGKYLFVNVQPTDLRTFTINADGSITQVSTVNA